MDISSLRNEIDQLDRQLVELLNGRAKVVQQIGSFKHSTNLPIREPEREAIVLQNIVKANAGPLTGSELQGIYSFILKVMRDVQSADRNRQHHETQHFKTSA